jgi:hypothetical protein
MSYYALIKNGIVEQLIVADYDFVQTLPNANEWVEVSEDENNTEKFANRGYLYNDQTKTFSPPQYENQED